jgi:pilus assembly protein CpaE
MSAVAAVAEKPSAQKREGLGVIAILQDQPTLERIQAIVRELHLDDELSLEPTLDAALRRMREGESPRVLILDLSDSAAPIAELSAARTVGGEDIKIVALGVVNDVALFRDLLAAGATDYVVKPVSREALAAALEKRSSTSAAGSGLGQVIAFIGSRGGVGTTMTAVSCAWVLAEKHNQPTALLDLDLHFGTVALKLDTDPGSGLSDALEQPSRIDSLFVERAMVKVSENLCILAAEAPMAQPLAIDPGAIDVLLYELRRKFAWVVVDMPRTVTSTQRVVLGAAARVAVVCERSLAGLRDTIRLQSLLREHAPQTSVLIVEAGASGERATVSKGEFEKAIGKSLDAVLPYDTKSAGAATNSGQPLPQAAPRSPVAREVDKLVAAITASPAQKSKKRKIFGIW